MAPFFYRRKAAGGDQGAGPGYIRMQQEYFFGKGCHKSWFHKFPHPPLRGYRLQKPPSNLFGFRWVILFLRPYQHGPI